MFAINAASINENDNNSSYLEKKKMFKQQTNVKKEPFNTNKVNSVIQRIHSNLDNDDESDSENNYKPTENNSNLNKNNHLPVLPENDTFNVNKNNINFFKNQINEEQTKKEAFKAISPTTFSNINNYSNYGNQQTIDEYYKRVLPGYNPNNVKNNPNPNTNLNANTIENDVLLKKINYIITLLEEQKDEKTGSATEEVVLYAFLGVFMIFLVDSFVNVGKYVR